MIVLFTFLFSHDMDVLMLYKHGNNRNPSLVFVLRGIPAEIDTSN